VKENDDNNAYDEDRKVDKKGRRRRKVILNIT
jgi:NADH:ubiquinone oxidoreductase subunit